MAAADRIAKFRKGVVLHGCRLCSFDLCALCFRRNATNISPTSLSRLERRKNEQQQKRQERQQRDEDEPSRWQQHWRQQQREKGQQQQQQQQQQQPRGEQQRQHQQTPSPPAKAAVASSSPPSPSPSPSWKPTARQVSFSSPLAPSAPPENSSGAFSKYSSLGSSPPATASQQPPPAPPLPDKQAARKPATGNFYDRITKKVPAPRAFLDEKFAPKPEQQQRQRQRQQPRAEQQREQWRRIGVRFEGSPVKPSQAGDLALAAVDSLMASMMDLARKPQEKKEKTSSLKKKEKKTRREEVQAAVASSTSKKTWSVSRGGRITKATANGANNGSSSSSSSSSEKGVKWAGTTYNAYTQLVRDEALRLSSKRSAIRLRENTNHAAVAAATATSGRAVYRSPPQEEKASILERASALVNAHRTAGRSTRDGDAGSFFSSGSTGALVNEIDHHISPVRTHNSYTATTALSTVL